MSSQNEVFRIESISQFNSMLGVETMHPLISIVDFSEISIKQPPNTKFACGFYSVMLKESLCAKLKYGQHFYDFQEGTIVCVGPNQVISFEEDEEAQNQLHEGWGIYFHPDLLRASDLASKMKNYNFFSYEINESLHLSLNEKASLKTCIENIKTEFQNSIDNHSNKIICSNIELFLNYCQRFYDRQFITRKLVNKDLLIKFENTVNAYIQSDLISTQGLPTVKYLATELGLSPNYMSDLLKKETGKNAKDHINFLLIEEAKNRLLLTQNSVSEIAYDLGFSYPQYFSRLFKQKTGQSPGDFRLNH
jgi:AraC-like DNA-binding protein